MKNTNTRALAAANAVQVEHRRAWRQLTDTAITPETALDHIRTFLEQAAPAGMQSRAITPTLHGVQVGVDHGFAVGATLFVQITQRLDDAVVNPDSILIEPTDKHEVAVPCSVVATVSWSGTTRSMSEAAASIFLYQQLVALGAAVEARFGHGVRITSRVTR